MTVKGELEKYMAILPDDICDIQRKETEKAFMAGAVAYRNISIDAAGRHTLELAETILQSAEKELQDYMIELLKGARV